MYRVLIFLACLAVGFGNNNTTTSVVKPTPTTIVNVSTLPQSSTKMLSTSVLTPHTTSISHSMNMSSSVPIPTPTSAPAPNSTVTTTTTKPTTAPTTPTTPPKPSEGDYSVKDKINGSYCLLAKLAVSFNISFNQNKTGKGNKTIAVKVFASFGMPFSNFSTEGSKCDTEKSTLKVSWQKENSSYSFTMSFGKTKGQNSASSGWKVTGVSLNVNVFLNATEKRLKFSVNETDLEDLSGSINGSYKCGITKDYPFDKNGMMKIKYARLQPFGVPSDKGKETFGTEKNCEPHAGKKSDNSNIVPIAVGCALAGLVVIVLIAYIIGRRKSQRGYEKV